ncbi:hypothetical protein [Nonomuraea sp. NPDC046570]
MRTGRAATRGRRTVERRHATARAFARGVMEGRAEIDNEEDR